MKCKNTLLGLVMIIAMALFTTSFNTHAQTASGLQPTVMSSAPPSATSSTGNGIIDQFKSFLMQPDTGYGTFNSNKTCDVWMGACFEQNVNADAIIGVDYQVWKKVSIDGYARLFNTDQTIKSMGAGPAVELSLGDLKFGGGIDGTWRFDDDCFAVSPFLQAKKGVGANSYLQLRLQTDFEFAPKGGSDERGSQKPFLATCFGINF
jgi:hypothetical protein